MAFLLFIFIALGQSPTSPDASAQFRTRLRQAISLSPQDVSTLAAATRAAVVGKTVRANGGAPFMQFDERGRVAWVHENLLLHYTYRPATFCGGRPPGPAGGDLVEQYRELPTGWVTGARVATPIEPTPKLFDILSSNLPLSDAGIRFIEGVIVRGIQAPWKAIRIQMETVRTEGPEIPDTTQTLWVDIDTLLPRRFEIAVNIAGIGDYGYDMQLTDGPDLRPPADVKAPDCVNPRNRGGIF